MLNVGLWTYLMFFLQYSQSCHLVIIYHQFSDWLRLLKHLSCLDVGSWHEPFRHRIQVWNIESPYPEIHRTENCGNHIIFYLVQPSPWSVSISQSSSPSSRGMLPSEAAKISELLEYYTLYDIYILPSNG